MADSFLFVDGFQPTRASKKQLRRHVMVGKNAGRTIHRKSRLHTSTVQRPLNNLALPGHSGWKRCVDSEKFDRGLGCALSTLSLPVEISIETIEIVNEFFESTTERIYPVHLGISLEEAKWSWLRLLFVDEPTFHCNVAVMQACNDNFKGHTHSPRAMQHLSRTFYHVQRILESDAALSDSSIAIVLSLIIQEQIRNHTHDASVHIKGLARMIELRGGLQELKSPTLVMKACKIDIIFAIQQGSPTMYFRDQWPDLLETSSHNALALDYLHNDLRAVYLDTMTACSLFNDSSHVMGLHIFEETATSLCYRLLQFRSVSEGISKVDEQSLLHLGLLIVAMTTFLKFGGRQIMEFPLMPKYLARTFQNDLITQPREVVLWLALLGGIWLTEDLDGDRLKSKVVETAQELNVKTWEAVQLCLRSLPWVNALHDKPGRQFWEKAVSKIEPISVD